MIISLTLSNIDNYNDSFLNKNIIKNDLKTNPFAKYLILVENDEVIGYLYYSDIYERAEINQIEIKNIHRNCGKATLLMQKLIDIVDKDISLEVKKDNLPAIKLYQKFSFKEVALRPGYYNGVDGILMLRKHQKTNN